MRYRVDASESQVCISLLIFEASAVVFCIICFVMVVAVVVPVMRPLRGSLKPVAAASAAMTLLAIGLPMPVARS